MTRTNILLSGIFRYAGEGQNYSEIIAEPFVDVLINQDKAEIMSKRIKGSSSKQIKSKEGEQMRLPEEQMSWIKYVVGYTSEGSNVYSGDMPREMRCQLEEFNKELRLHRTMPVFKEMIESGEDPREVLLEDEIKLCIENFKIRPDKIHLYEEWINILKEEFYSEK